MINIGNIVRFALAAIVGSPATQASPLGRWERRRSKILFQDQRISVGFSGNGLRAFLGAPYPEVPGNFSTRGTIPITGRCLRLSPGLNPKPEKNGIIDRLSRPPVRETFCPIRAHSPQFPGKPRNYKLGPPLVVVVLPRVVSCVRSDSYANSFLQWSIPVDYYQPGRFYRSCFSRAGWPGLVGLEELGGRTYPVPVTKEGSLGTPWGES